MFANLYLKFDQKRGKTEQQILVGFFRELKK